jgi:hypothetical protein
MQAVLDALWAHLLPGLGASGDDSAQEELSARLARLALPACPAGAAPADGPAPAGAPFQVAAGGGELATTLDSVSVAPRGEGWEVTLAEADNAVTFGAGAGTWAVSTPADQRGGQIPVAASGGWVDGTLRLEVIFLETPHRMDIELHPDGHTATAAWRIPPLFAGHLADLACP